jgi:Raf kinase inhibitor-like YbhB/YbcL family protein
VRRGDQRGRGRLAGALAWLAGGSLPGRVGLLARVSLLVSVGLLAGGCGLLSKPTPVSAGSPVRVTVNSPVFAKGVIPARFTCYGKRHGVSPPIFWSGTPAGTKSIAIVVDDSAAPITPNAYWIVFDIGPSTTDLQVGALPPHARMAQNSTGKAAYDAPCPVGRPHNYRFTVYALNTFLGRMLPGDPPILQAWTIIAKHVIGRGTMTAKACPNALAPVNGLCQTPVSGSGT